MTAETRGIMARRLRGTAATIAADTLQMREAAPELADAEGFRVAVAALNAGTAELVRLADALERGEEVAEITETELIP